MNFYVAYVVLLLTCIVYTVRLCRCFDFPTSRLCFVNSCETSSASIETITNAIDGVYVTSCRAEESHAAKVSTCIQHNHMQPSGHDMFNATKCSPGNYLQSRHPYALNASTCHHGNCMQAMHLHVLAV